MKIFYYIFLHYEEKFKIPNSIKFIKEIIFIKKCTIKKKYL